ncbi:MAG: carboxypeptidase-like regulatory domain-containing protein [Planctomycetota bacterium]
MASLLILGCGTGLDSDTGRDVETGYAFTNLSRSRYAALEIRPHGGDQPFASTSLLAPGATQRLRFLEVFGDACPDALDMRVSLYARVNEDTPIGIDEGEVVQDQPLTVGEIEDIPLCSADVLETFTIVNWDAPEGTGRVKLAQGTSLDELYFELGLFPNEDNVWEFAGRADGFKDLDAPALASMESLTGRVISPEGAGISDIGVLIRSRFRVRLNDEDLSNDPDSGFGEPVAFTTTDEDGAFAIDRPAGVYRVEFFADGFLFRPVFMDVEVPAGSLISIAEVAP